MSIKKSKNEPTAREIIESLGRDVVAASLGVSESSVKNAVGSSMPARWFNVMEGLCQKSGIDCPRSAFAFRTAAEVSQ